MNKKYKVEWAAIAEDDLKQIIKYAAMDSPVNALRILAKIKQKATSLYTPPQRGRVIPELQGQGIKHLPGFIVDNWRIVYRVTDAIVYVLSVIDSRQNVEDILLKRLIK
jgi:toxin ParE1/3/4